MADTPPTLVFDTATRPQVGVAVEVAPDLVRLTAPNGGPFTFTGTNSFIIGRDTVAILDPGPADPQHISRLMAAVGSRRIEAILLTHTHKDHSASARALSVQTGAPLWFAGPHRLSRPPHLLEMNALARDCDWGLTPDRTFFDSERFEVGGTAMEAIATPGHCANHMCYGFPSNGILLSGDHVMGWNSTLVAVPDGSMADYLASLRKVMALPYMHYFPAHGGAIADGPAYARALLGHRQLRNQQIADAVTGGARSIHELLDRIYPTLTGALRFAAAMTIRAHVEYLDGLGKIRARRRLVGGMVLSPA